jgi:hypothetical protein
MLNNHFNPLKELQEIKERREMIKRRLYRKSKLEKYRSELVAMRQAGASAQDLVVWLKMKHRLKIHRSSIDRYLSGLPELTVTPSVEPPKQKPSTLAVEGEQHQLSEIN